jgi:hypothetical protein
MSKSRSRTLTFWVVPTIGVLGGAALYIAAWQGGHPVAGLGMFAIMIAFSAGTVLIARRSETVRGLLDRRDERFVAIDLQATAASGGITMLVIVIASIVELARGHSGAPFTWLAAVAGVSYLAGVAVLRIRG